MTRKKSKTDQAKIAMSRLLQDEDVQKQLRFAVRRLREAWGRVSGRPASKAISDKQVYSKVRDAATSLTVAGKALRKKPEPPKRRGRRLVAGAAIGGGVAYVMVKRRGNGGDGGIDTLTPDPTGPVAAPTPPTPVPAA
jgi:hypothetical protein